MHLEWQLKGVAGCSDSVPEGCDVLHMLSLAKAQKVLRLKMNQDHLDVHCQQQGVG